jgi:hypothetical protein
MTPPPLEWPSLQKKMQVSIRALLPKQHDAD